MEFVVIDDEDDSTSEFNYGSARSNGGSGSSGNRILVDKLRDSLGFNDEDLVITNNSLNRRNVNNNRENEVQSQDVNANANSARGRGRTDSSSRERRLPVHKFNSRNFDQQDHDLDGHHRKQPASGMTRRCACNLSQCASTNYMCKSERRVIPNGDGTSTEMESGCFVEELEPGTLEVLTNGGGGLKEANGKVTSARRGCIEMLSKEKFKQCSNIPGSSVHCCFDEDMCNYPKTFYPPQIHNSHQIHNRISFDSQNGSMSPNLDQQVWLRAALLTIPIFGIIILIILIVFARRMLKNDAKDKEYRTARSHHRRSHKACPNHPSTSISVPSSSPATFQPNTSNSSSCPLVRPSGSPLMPAAELHC